MNWIQYLDIPDSGLLDSGYCSYLRAESQSCSDILNIGKECFWDVYLLLDVSLEKLLDEVDKLILSFR